MAPTAHVIVYYIRDDGEVIADALDVELEGALQNFVRAYVIYNINQYTIIIIRNVITRYSLFLFFSWS